MGYGGHLLWTAAARVLREHSGTPWCVAYRPMLSDLLTGHLHARDRSAADDPIFMHNPGLKTTVVRRKGAFARKIDDRFEKMLNRRGRVRTFEKFVLILCRCCKKKLIHLDMNLHHYAAQETTDRWLWKDRPSITDCLLEHFPGVEASSKAYPELFFSSEEEAWVRGWLDENELVPGSYSVVEPHTKEDWFGKLRSWPWDNWLCLFDDFLSATSSTWIQVGVENKAIIPGVRNVTGQLTFRQTALLMKSSGLFLGTEGGLMHVAAAVGVPSVIIYGGITRPEFSGYPEKHKIVCNYVDCIHCGYKGCCPNGHICMESILPEQVADAIRELRAAEH